jgi:translation initiation factor 1
VTRPGRDANSRLVYSTDGGRIAPAKPSPSPRPAGPGAPPNDGVVRVARETKGRGGKTVSIVHGLPASEAERVLKQLKTKLGTGGAIEGTTLVIQGDHRERIAAELKALGFTAKVAGG